MLDNDAAPSADEEVVDAGELPPSSTNGETPSPDAPALPDAQELRNRLAAMGREKQMADARAQQLEAQVGRLSQTVGQWQTQQYQQAEQAELAHIAKLPVHEQALARAERAERKLDELRAYEVQKNNAQQQDAYMRAESERLLRLANESYGLAGTDQEIRYDQLHQQAWSSRDAYIAALAAMGQTRQEMGVSKKAQGKSPAAGQTDAERIKAGVQAALAELGVSSGASPRPSAGKRDSEGAIDAIVMAPRSNARFKTDGPQAQVARLKEARALLAAKAK